MLLVYALPLWCNCYTDTCHYGVTATLTHGSGIYHSILWQGLFWTPRYLRSLWNIYDNEFMTIHSLMLPWTCCIMHLSYAQSQWLLTHKLKICPNWPKMPHQNHFTGPVQYHTYTNIPFPGKFFRQYALSPTQYISLKKPIKQNTCMTCVISEVTEKHLWWSLIR
jgi:hypothetical protein